LLFPVDGDHVRINPDGSGDYREHGEFVPFTVLASEVASIFGDLSDLGDGSDGCDTDVLVFGVGLGELLRPLLAAWPALKFVAWDRDPWLMRQMLIARDFSEPLASGRLTLKLGADILDLVRWPRELKVMEHPFLRDIYGFELHLLQYGIGERTVALADATLYREDLAYALRQAGFTVFPIEVLRWSEQELQYALQRIEPEFVARINYTQDLAEFCRIAGCPLMVWQIDPTIDYRFEVSGSTDHTHIFTYRRSNVDEFRRAGFQHVEYLPLTANLARRRPLSLNVDEQRRFGAAVSFVGSSLVITATTLQEQLCALYAEWHTDGLGALPDFRAKIGEVLDRQGDDFSHWRLPEFMLQSFGDFLSEVRKGSHAVDPVVLLGERAASERRLMTISSLASSISETIHAWGDDHWKKLEEDGVHYCGFAGHRDELPRIFNASTIDIDIGRIYQTNMVTMRVFDVLACGGFLITERNQALEELFGVGIELETYSTLDELCEKTVYYLAHPDEARTIAERGLEAVRERHDVRLRVRRMLTVMGLQRASVPA